MAIKMHAEDFLILLKHATAKPLTPEARAELKAALEHSFPEQVAAAELKHRQDEAITAGKMIEDAQEAYWKDSPSRKLAENIIRAFGTDVTLSDLAEYGEAMISESAEATKNKKTN
jgi:hypothetical protein